MHAQRDIVLPIPSVCPMSVCAHRNGHIVTLFDILVRESFQFSFCALPLSKIPMGTSLAGAVNTEVEFFFAIFD